MNWRKLLPFNVFSQKATEVHNAIVQVMGVEPQWNERNYEAFAKEGYNANVWVYRCIQAIAQGVAGVPWILYQVDSKGDRKRIEGHAVLNLLDKPNEIQSRQEFFESYVSYALISGNSYLDMVGPNDVAPPRELWALRPDRMQVIPDKSNFINGYLYKVGDQSIKLDRRRISHLRYFNPTNDFYGLAPIEVAARGIDNDNAANAWNNGLLTNGARPSGALVTDDTLSESQYNNLKRETDKTYSGAKNAGKPMLLEGGLKWIEMALSPKDMDFSGSKKMSRVEICAAFGVPPEVVGDKEHATYSNYQEARKALYEDAVLPMLDRVMDKFNNDLVPRFGDNLYIEYDKDAIEALQENRDQVYKRAAVGYKDELLTKNEARKEMGYEDVDGGDDFYTAPVPSYGLGTGRDIEKPDPEKRDEEEKDFFLSIKSFNLETEEQKTMYWKSMDRRRETFYKRVAERVQLQFETERVAVLAAYDEGGEAEAVNAVNEEKEAWHKLYISIYVEVMQSFGDQMLDQFKSSGNGLELKGPAIPLQTAFNVFDKAVQAFITNTVAKKVVLVTDTTKGKIRQIIGDLEAEGAGIVDIAAALDGLYLDQIIPNRSTVIARTEVIGASNAGNREAVKQTELELVKEWLSTRDDRTRGSHYDMDGETQEMDDEYSNGLLFPGDPSGTAAEVIQCRCTEVYSVRK